MNKIIHDPFTYHLPKLDLHGETTETFRYLLDTFINDNIKLHNEDIVVIHGKGTGVLRNAVFEYLKHHNSVISFNMDPWNEGQVIIKIKLH